VIRLYNLQHDQYKYNETIQRKMHFTQANIYTNRSTTLTLTSQKQKSYTLLKNYEKETTKQVITKTDLTANKHAAKSRVKK